MPTEVCGIHAASEAVSRHPCRVSTAPPTRPYPSTPPATGPQPPPVVPAAPARSLGARSHLRPAVSSRGQLARLGGLRLASNSLPAASILRPLHAVALPVMCVPASAAGARR